MYTSEEGTVNEAHHCHADKTQTFTAGSGEIEKAQKALGARTETETIERALEIVIGEDEKNRRAWSATEKLLKSGIEIKDVFGHLNDK